MGQGFARYLVNIIIHNAVSRDYVEAGNWHEDGNKLFGICWETYSEQLCVHYELQAIDHCPQLAQQPTKKHI